MNTFSYRLTLKKSRDTCQEENSWRIVSCPSGNYLAGANEIFLNSTSLLTEG
jgi:hypothetical protein